MRVLIVNKFLFPNGGSETYIFKLGKYLQSMGHEVQYFGMEHEGRCVGNRVGSYTSKMDFHGGNKAAKIFYTFKTIYSFEARKKLRAVLDDFRPDVVHLNNFNYQLTPSVIVETISWRKSNSKDCKILYTAHDYQLICPNHLCHNPNTHENCDKCLGDGGHRRKFHNCIKNKCIHGSIVRSVVGCMEAWYWNFRGTYQYIDKIICCSEFLKKKMDSNPLFADKTVVIRNFIDKEMSEMPTQAQEEKKDFVLYFGRFSEEKGISTLIAACRALPAINFVFAGAGESALEKNMEQIENITNMGFQTGERLEMLIRKARFSVYPSEWYENCPYSVMESQIYGTPVLGADIGGIPELIRQGETGELFQSGDMESLSEKILYLWENPGVTEKMSENCRNARFEDPVSYISKFLNVIETVHI